MPSIRRTHLVLFALCLPLLACPSDKDSSSDDTAATGDTGVAGVQPPLGGSSGGSGGDDHATSTTLDVGLASPSVNLL